MAAATPSPTRRCLGAAGADAPGAVPFGPPARGTVGWVCGWGPPKAGGTWPGCVTPCDRGRSRLLRVLRSVVGLRRLTRLVDGAGRGGGCGAAGAAGATGAAGSTGAGAAAADAGAGVGTSAATSAAGVAGVSVAAGASTAGAVSGAGVVSGAWACAAGAAAVSVTSPSRGSPVAPLVVSVMSAPSKAMPASRRKLCAPSAESVTLLSASGDSPEHADPHALRPRASVPARPSRTV